jgi:hypothetical protein
MTTINKINEPLSNIKLLYAIFILSIVSIPIILLINNYAYDNNGKLVCDDYVLNSYLYTILGFCYVALGVLLEQKIRLLDIVENQGIFIMIVFIIIYLLIMYKLFNMIRNTDPNNFITINILFALVSILFGIILSVIIIIGFNLNFLLPAIAITIGLTFIMGFIGYKYGHKFITYNFDKYLSYALAGLILWIFIVPLYITDIRTRLLITSIPSIIIFCLLLMSYNKKLRENSENCVVPNYPNEAIGLIIKIGNILNDVIRILLALRGTSRR